MPKRDENGGFWFTTDTGIHIYCEQGQSKEDAIKERFDKSSGSRLHEKRFENRTGFEATGKKVSSLWGHEDFAEDEYKTLKEDEPTDPAKFEEWDKNKKYVKGSYDELMEKYGRSIYDVIEEKEAHERFEKARSEKYNDPRYYQYAKAETEDFKRAVKDFFDSKDKFTKDFTKKNGDAFEAKARKMGILTRFWHLDIDWGEYPFKK